MKQSLKLCAFADEAGLMIEQQIKVLKRNDISNLEIRFVDGSGIADITAEKAKEVNHKQTKNGISVWAMGSPFGKILRATPMGRFGEAEELLGTLRWLTDETASGFVTGVVVPVDGGFSAYSGVQFLRSIEIKTGRNPSFQPVFSCLFLGYKRIDPKNLARFRA